MQSFNSSWLQHKRFDVEIKVRIQFFSCWLMSVYSLHSLKNILVSSVQFFRKDIMKND